MGEILNCIISGSIIVVVIMLFSWNSIGVCIYGVGNKLYFINKGNLDLDIVNIYSFDLLFNVFKVWLVYVCVKVCDLLWFEVNCMKYGSNYKLEGLM